MVHTLTLQYGDEVFFSLGLSAQEFSEEARFLLAAKLYELGRLTSGQAAELCGKGRSSSSCRCPVLACRWPTSNPKTHPTSCASRSMAEFRVVNTDPLSALQRMNALDLGEQLPYKFA